MSSTGMVEPLRNTDRSPGVGACCWCQRWADSRLPDTSTHCRIDTGTKWHQAPTPHVTKRIMQL